MTAASFRSAPRSPRLVRGARALLVLVTLTACDLAEASDCVVDRWPTASTCLLTSAGVFFGVGLVFGAWKYACMARSEEAQAHPYVDIAHRAALLYGFACALVAQLAAVSAWSNAVNLAAAIVLVLYFAMAVLSYAVHAALRDTDNQLRRPHRLGTTTVGDRVMRTFMVSLIVAEIGAFLVIFSGYLAA